MVFNHGQISHLISIIHTHGNASTLEVKYIHLRRLTTASWCEHELKFTRSGSDEVRRTILQLEMSVFVH